MNLDELQSLLLGKMFIRGLKKMLSNSTPKKKGETYKKEVEKRSYCIDHYYKAGKHYALYRKENPITGEIKEWKEIIYSDPYELYR